MVFLKINRQGTEPIHRQIAQQIARLVDRGALIPGSRLPSTRMLADQLQVNRTTIYRAYGELSALGYISSTPGSYTLVRQRPATMLEVPHTQESWINWAEIANPGSRAMDEAMRLWRTGHEAGLTQTIDFSWLGLDSRLFPLADFQRCLARVMTHEGNALLCYGDYAGYRPLRECIAERMRLQGVAVTAEEIIVTNGGQQALDLILRLIAVPDLPVAVEAPTYALFIPLLKYYRIQAVEIPMRADGMDLGRLADVLRKTRLGLVYTMPTFHNPMGISTSQEHRERLLKLCTEHALPLVEDGFEEELKYFGKVTQPLKSMDAHGIVIYVGTFSKALFPGIRIGWIAAPVECIQRLTAIRRYTEIGGNLILQAALERFIRSEQYDRHVRRVHRVFRTRMRTACDALEQYLPPGCSWTHPDGGFTIWVTLPVPYTCAGELAALLLRHGVAATPGECFFVHGTPRRHLRLSISTLDTEEIVAGAKRLGRAIEELMRVPA